MTRSALQDVKQVIIVRLDLGMGKGKIAAQSSHASVLATLEAKKNNKTWFDAWFKYGMKKIVVKVRSEDKLRELYQKSIHAKLPCAIINDAGHTQLPPGTTTAVAIGPAPESQVDSITGNLKLL